MKTLIVDDNATDRKLLQIMLRPYGTSDTAVDGNDALRAIDGAIAGGQPYDLVCLDIKMPNMDGQAALRAIRDAESRRGVAAGQGVKVVMMTCLNDKLNVITAFREQCDGYLVKPVERKKLSGVLEKLGLVEAAQSR